MSTDCDGDGVPDECGSGPCPADLDDSGDVGFVDLLRVLANWGCTDCPEEDLDDDGSVGFGDLLTVLATWGPCPGSLVWPLPLCFDDALESVGLSPAEYDVFADCLMNGTGSEQKNCACWLEHYISTCWPGCQQPPSCPGNDPLQNH